MRQVIDPWPIRSSTSGQVNDPAFISYTGRVCLSSEYAGERRIRRRRSSHLRRCTARKTRTSVASAGVEYGHRQVVEIFRNLGLDWSVVFFEEQRRSVHPRETARLDTSHLLDELVHLWWQILACKIHNHGKRFRSGTLRYAIARTLHQI